MWYIIIFLVKDNPITMAHERKKSSKDDEEEKVTWKKSLAKKLLAQDIIAGEIDSDMDWNDVFWYRPEYAATSHRLFNGRLQRLLAAISSSRADALLDEDALKNDRRLFPKKSHNYRGEPQWDGSAAQSWLRIDVAEGKPDECSPKELYKTRKAYQVYPLKVFREHIHQEIRFQKFCTWRNETKKKKATEWK